MAVFLLSSGIGLIFTIALVGLADLKDWCCVNSVTFQDASVSILSLPRLRPCPAAGGRRRRVWGRGETLSAPPRFWIALSRRERIVIMEACKLSSTRWVASTACAGLPTLGTAA